MGRPIKIKDTDNDKLYLQVVVMNTFADHLICKIEILEIEEAFVLR